MVVCYASKNSFSIENLYSPHNSMYYVFISNTHIGLIQILRRLDAKICLGVQRE